MIKLVDLIKENKKEIDTQRLFYNSSGGISEYTVIVYDPIPIKYLSLYD